MTSHRIISLLLILGLLFSLASASATAQHGTSATKLRTAISQAMSGGIDLLNDGRLRWDETPWLAGDIQTFLVSHASPLAEQVVSTGQQSRPVSDLLSAASVRYGINPKVLLTLIEIQTRLVSDSASNSSLAAPLRNPAPDVQGFDLQLLWGAELLDKESVRWSVERDAAPSIILADGTTVAADTFANSASYALVCVLASGMRQSDWQHFREENRFESTYTRFFGVSPLALVKEPKHPLVPPFLKSPLDGAYDQNRYSQFDHEYPNYLEEPPDEKTTIVVTSGDRRDGSSANCTGYFSCYSGHSGYDYPTYVGSDVYAAGSGSVIWADVSNECGDPNTMGIIIDHQNGYRTMYWHLSGFEVSEGQQVTRGQLIGKSGDSGCSTGPHLHFEVRKNNVRLDPFGWSGGYTEPCTQNGTCQAGEWLWDTGGCTDTIPPDGDYYDGMPQAGGSYRDQVYLRAWAQDHGCDPPSGVDGILFRAYYNGGWHTVRDDNGDCAGDSRCDYEYTWNLNGVPDGPVTLGFDIRDKNGNWAYTPQGVIVIHKYSDDPPHVSFDYANGMWVGVNGQVFESNNPNWSFAGTASDVHGVDHVDYHSVGSNGTLTERANGTAAWSYSRIGLTGHNLIYFFAYDNLGQQSPDSDKHYIDLYVDTAPPSTGHNLSGTMGDNGWYRSNVDVHLVANDNGSGNGSYHWAAGVQTLYYKVDGDAWQQYGGSSKTITVSGDGSHTVRYYARDEVGNQEGEKQVTFKIDATPPTAPGAATETHGVISGQWQKAVNDPAFTWVPAGDSTSGLWYYWVSWDGTLQVMANPAYDPPAVGTDSHPLSVQAVDQAGNPGPAGAAFAFNYDGTPPHAPEVHHNTQGVASGVWQKLTRTADFAWPVPFDAGSGIAGYNVYWGPDPGGTSDVLTPDNTFADPTPICGPDEAAIYYLNTRSEDHVGWHSEWVTYALAYDGAPPTAALVANYGLTTTHQTIVHLDIAGTDEGSGLALMRLSNDGYNWTDWSDYQPELYWQIPDVGRRLHPIYLILADGVGNLSPVVSDTVYLDVNVPRPKSENYWLWDDTMPAGAVEADSTSYRLRSTVGQSLDSPQLASPQFTIYSGYQAGALAEPTLTPTYTTYFQIGFVVAGGGTGADTLQSPSYQIYGTLGQPAVVGVITSTNYLLYTGFWGGPGVDPPPPGEVEPPDEPPLPPCEFYSLSINDGALFTNSPAVTLTLCGPDAEEVKLSNDGGFGGAIWQPYTTTVPWTLDVYGQYVLPRFVYSRFRDHAGTIYGTFFDDIVYDPTAPGGEVAFDLASLLPPTGTLSFEPRQLPVLVEESADLFISALDDNSGLAEMQVSFSPIFSGAVWLPYQAIVPVTFTVEGTNTLYVRFRDRAGNISDSANASTIVDTIAPSATVSMVDGIVGPHTMSVTVSLDASESGPGIEVRVGASPTFTDTLWKPYTPLITVPAVFSGVEQYVLYVQLHDAAGNVSSVYTTTYRVDMTAPYGTARVEPGLGGVRTVSLDALDLGSGVSKIWLSPDDSFVQNVSILPYADSISWDFSQWPVLHIMFEDAVGNLGSPISVAAFEPSRVNLVYLPIVVKKW